MQLPRIVSIRAQAINPSSLERWPRSGPEIATRVAVYGARQPLWPATP